MSDKQTILVPVEFEVEHSPGNEEHLKQILENYLRPKGVKYKDGKIII